MYRKTKMTERNIFTLISMLAKTISDNGVADTHGTLLDDIVATILMEFPGQYPIEEMEVSAKVYLIIKTVAQVYNVSISDIYGNKGVDGIRDARNMVYYL